MDTTKFEQTKRDLQRKYSITSFEALSLALQVERNELLREQNEILKVLAKYTNGN